MRIRPRRHARHHVQTRRIHDGERGIRLRKYQQRLRRSALRAQNATDCQRAQQQCAIDSQVHDCQLYYLLRDPPKLRPGLRGIEGRYGVGAGR
jgi:hypothetical protein